MDSKRRATNPGRAFVTAFRPACVLLFACAGTVHAQSTVDTLLDPVVVSASRREEASFDVPASIDVIDASTIRDGRPMVNLSETLVRAPGIVANNRQNYAQDLAISSRGFGARAAFGVRGIRLWQDDIPQTMPDGQGQTGSFLLLSAARIEVLRGPFSVRYGNASGGVISVVTEGAPETPDAGGWAGAGSDDAWTLSAKAGGRIGAAELVGAASRFSTDGYRDHSAARRDLAIGKLVLPFSGDTRLTVVGTLQDQPESLDPLGLTRAQWDADPRQADAVATQFDTRKTVRQQQLGASLEHRIAPATRLVATAYGGHRQIEQYLAFTGVAPASGGGVVDLDRDYAGVSVRGEHAVEVNGVRLVASAGAEFESMDERRKGFVNDFGSKGALKRDENDEVRSTSAYAEVVAWLAPAVSLTAGVRTTEVRFEVTDEYVTPGNPDDSGSRTFRATTPMVAALWQPDPSLSLYASWGEGFETPTFAELAYRVDGPGFNAALVPATSRNLEIGLKARLAGAQRVNLALFRIDTDDEIVVDAATDGRTAYRNAGRTRREGVEVAWDGRFGDFFLHANATYLDARFRDAYTAGNPPLEVPAGRRLPGVPERSAYVEVAWRPASLPWLALAGEVQHSGKVYVNDRNSEAAPSWTIGAVRAVARREVGGWALSAFVRVDNVTDEKYVGSVIVGDTNGRYFEPAPGRTVFAGASARYFF